MFELKLKVKRKRYSVTQGEAEVFANGELIAIYGDDIVLQGENYKIGDFGSKHDDKYFLEAALKQYTSKIIMCLGGVNHE